MATSMGPPPPPGFSLRVQIFSPHAHALNDTPLRSLRVLTTPDTTVEKFCAEVSRRYESSYGERLAIKRCQDDKGFDILLADTLVGFANLDIIRITQASLTPGIRDSVPPTSALRFDPSKPLSRKREREGSARPNRSPSSSTWQPSKRQRVSDLDPDEPLPSRELNVGGTINEEDKPRDEIIPNSQQETVHGRNHGIVRHVGQDPRISETPSPPPELPSFLHLENGSDDLQSRNFNALNTHEPLNSQVSIQSPFGPASSRTQNSARPHNVHYHTQRAIERGTSVSSAATSPSSFNQQGPTTNGTTPSKKRKLSDPAPEAPKINGKPSSTSTNGNSIYECVPSDSESHDVLKRTADRLKPKKSSPSGLPGLNWAKKFNTPPNGDRTSRSQDRLTHGELPLTPNSREREERQRQNEQTNKATQAKWATAPTTEQRKREANESQVAEEQKVIQTLREKSDREAQGKRKAVIATATRLEEERVEQMERDRKTNMEKEAERISLEQQRNQEKAELALLKPKKQSTSFREQQEQESLAKEELARKEKERQEPAKLGREKVTVARANRGREEEAQRRSEETALAALAVESTRKSREPSEQSKVITPARSKATSIRPQSSSTTFIPSGRKSALKAPSSQAAGSPSPVLARTVSAGSSNVSQADVPPSETKRRVSFLDDALDNETPKETAPRTTILPPSRVSAAKAPIVGIVKHSTTPIPPPTMRRSSKAQSTTTLVQPAIVPPQLRVAPKPATKVLPPVTKSMSPATQSSSHNRDTSNTSIKPKELQKSAPPLLTRVTVSSSKASNEEDKFEDKSEEVKKTDKVDKEQGAQSEDNEEDEEEDEDEEDEEEEEANEDDEDLNDPNRLDPVEALNSSIRSLKPHFEPKSEPTSQDGDKREAIEMQDLQSNRSSSRSPILFNSRSAPRKLEPTQPMESASSTSNTSSDEDDESVDEDESGDDEEVAYDEDKTIPAKAQRSSASSLPALKPTLSIVPERKPSKLSSAAVNNTSIHIPSSNNPARPKFAIGASLWDMNAKNPLLSSSASKANKTRPLKLAEDDDEESEEESEEELDDDSDNEPEASQTLLKTIRSQRSKPNGSESNEADSDDADSDVESESVEESEEDMKKHQDDLADKISKLISESQSNAQIYNDVPSPKAVNGSQPSISSATKGKGKTGSGKSSIRYQFSQPKWN